MHPPRASGVYDMVLEHFLVVIGALAPTGRAATSERLAAAKAEAGTEPAASITCEWSA